MEYRVKFEYATAVYNSARTPSLAVYLEDGTSIQPVIDNGFASESKGAEGGNISSLGGYYNEIRYFLECLDSGKEIRTARLRKESSLSG